MMYQNAQEWRAAPNKRVLLFGMSGLGKTYLSRMLRSAGGWYHYSVDYRIGTRYLGEHIADNLKREAMKNPFLARLFKSNSVYIGSNITFENLAPLSTFLGKPGDPARGGLPFDEYMRRQALHRDGEIAALCDTPHFIARAQAIYGYQNFVCDSGGSICEVVNPADPADPVLTRLSENLLLVWIKGSEAHTGELIRRFTADPKPMYYEPGLMRTYWDDYIATAGMAEDEVDPDDFMRATYARALAHRQPIYAAMADNWGVTVEADEVARVKTPDDFNALVARALEAR